MTAYTANLVDASPDVTLTVTAPDGRVLLVTVALNTTTDHLTHDPAAPAPALVIYLDTDGRQPMPSGCASTSIRRAGVQLPARAALVRRRPGPPCVTEEEI